MADHHKDVEKEKDEKEGESLLDKIANKIHHDDSSSSSDSGDEKTFSIKAKVYRLFGWDKPIHGVLGAADVMLWRNKKVSGGVLVVATNIWFLFEVLEYHPIIVFCHGLILGLAFVFLWSNASTVIRRYRPRIPNVDIPEDRLLKVALALRIQINHTFAILRNIVTRRDVKKFCLVIASLWVISILGSWCNLLTLLYTITLMVLSVPMLYEKYEYQVDSFAEKAMAELKKQYAEFDDKVLSKIPKEPMKDKKGD